MAGASDYSAQKYLDWITGKTSMPSASARYVALFTAVGADDGTGFTEPSGADGYARVATAGSDWNAASGSAPSSVTNATDIVFPTAGGSGFGTIIAWGLYDASTSGNLIQWDFLGAYDWLEFSCTSASPGVLTVPAHGYANGDLVQIDAEFGGEALPTTGGSWTGAKTVAGVTTDTFTCGVNTTGTGGGMVRKMLQQAVASGVTFRFASSNITLRAA